MYDVKWIKITTNIFDDEKLLLIESMPSADSIITIWFKLLVLAGKTNNGGVFMLNDRIAYTDEMLATIFRRDVNVVRLALQTFEEFGMIEIINGAITIPNWAKHQSLDALEAKKERDRLYQKKRREAQKLLANNADANAKTAISEKSSDASSDMSSDNRLTPNDSRFTEKDIEKEEEKEREKEGDIEKISCPTQTTSQHTNYNKIVEMFNDICTSLPKVRSLTKDRQSKIRIRLNSFSEAQLIEAFHAAEESDFFSGRSGQWQGTFDWIIKSDANMTKLLEGNYKNKEQGAKARVDFWNDFIDEGEK